ncbi:MAG: glycoside hydrolase family 28 protein [Asticcacaulis sp.]|nr:glycoside hydrolase family 28 protein [Asticcacaulis sp.]
MSLNRRHLWQAGASTALSLLGGSAVRAAEAAGASLTGQDAQGLNARHFGARGDGVTIDSAAINRCIDEVARRGGGTVYIPAGVYACYTLRLKSHITLNLDQGATILAAPTPRDGMASGGYDHAEPQGAWEPYQDFGHNHWRNSLIWGEGLSDIAIIGRGLIWGKGLSRGWETETTLPDSSRPGVGNKAIALKNCHNVLLRDFSVLQGGWFALLATGVDNLTIDNLVIDTNRDGLDIDCCRNVRVSRCTVNSPWDDAICPKSSYALGYARSTEGVTISDCLVSGGYEMGSVLDGTWKRFEGAAAANAYGRIKMGTESNGGFKNITISNCVFDQSRGFCLESVDGAHIEDISITGITMRGTTTAPFFLRLGQRLRGPAGTQIGSIKRVLIGNVTSSGAVQLPSIIAGLQGHPIEDILIHDVYLQQVGGAPQAMADIVPPENADQYPEPSMFGDLPATGLYARHAKNIEMRHVDITTVAPDARPALWLEDVAGADLFAVEAPSRPGVALTQVSGFRTFGSRTIPDTRFDTATTTTL